jgi:two-component system, LytTR family, sensor histidine kinase AlgZ
MKNAALPKIFIGFKRFLWQTLLIDTLATLFVICLTYVRFGWREAVSTTNLATSIVYSFCIGTLCGIVITLGVPYFSADSTFVRFVKLTVSLFIATLLGITIGNVLLSIIGVSTWNQVFSPSVSDVVFSSTIAFGFGFSVYFYEFSQAKLRQKEIDAERSKTLASEAQLASLESRIHPHFLFNTLNSIAALIREEPVLAEKTVEKLSALLRYSLDSNVKSLVPLEQELEITEKYLDIEKVRFDKRLAYKIDCEPKFLETKLPPLSLQTLVENSIKHVVSNTSEQTEITISVKELGESIEISVCDSGSGFNRNDLKENHGLDILQKRLETIFGDKAILEIVGNGKVKLRLPK